MTASEAITTLNLIRGGGYNNLDYRRVQMACTVAIEALFKQIPKEAKTETYFYGENIYCPHCNHPLEQKHREGNIIYCEKCGVALIIGGLIE